MPHAVLLTGATGFVGGHLHSALLDAGVQVRAMTRRPKTAQDHHPRTTWVQGDVRDAASLETAADGCDAAYYLVHGLGGGPDLVERETRAAANFSRAMRRAGVGRIVYLGGIAPQGPPSDHLLSRLEVGRVLRAGPVPTIELRASMIIGHGSLSWLIVRDLAARLPAMVLPAWLRSRTEPVAIDDVVAALGGALDVAPMTGDLSYDIPGPDVLSGREILESTAEALGLRRPVIVEAPVLTPRLSSKWVHFVTRARWEVAREIVVGLEHDVLARDATYWRLIDHEARVPFPEAARRALAAERESEATGIWGSVERSLQRHWHMA